MRLIVRRVKSSRRDAKKLTAFEKRTGWRYQIVATNIPAHQGLSGVPGSGQVWFVDALYRDHAEVEDRVKAIKRVGLGLLPSKSWQFNTAWALAATIAADLDAWTRLLLLHDEPELAAAEPETIRMKLYHLPGSPPTPAGAPCAWTAPGPGHTHSPSPGSAPPSFRPSPEGRPPPRRHRKGRTLHPRTRGTRRSAASRDGQSRHGTGHNGQPAAHDVAVSPWKNRG
ncbi:transposase [Kutzneria sp. CA-103260]|uniref:transposase n=1 Tax=Kutzneria sp. CA-103260 TaxID=2802641 RepID=UPI001BA6876E|nr:transposase [Kutzneria sp. CA-103260]